MYLEVEGAKTYVYTGAQAFNADQPSILFVHGAACDHTVWVLQSRYFAHHRYNALAVDLPGHGRSEGKACESIEAYADWVVKVLDGLEIEKAVVVGHSMGALVTIECAARHPQRISHLGLVGISTPMLVSDVLLDAAEANDHSAFDMVNIWGHTLGHIGGHRAPGMWMMGSTVRLLERSGPGVMHNDLKACNDYDLGDSAKKIGCRTLLLLGELDMMSPPKRAQNLIADLQEAEVREVASSGHMIMAERPDEVLDGLIKLVS